METKRKKELFNKIKGKKWIARVVNTDKNGSIETGFNSKIHTFENILHKIELDLYTSLELGLTLPIVVQIKEVKDLEKNKKKKTLKLTN